MRDLRHELYIEERVEALVNILPNALTVQELIEILKEYPNDMQVVVGWGSLVDNFLQIIIGEKCLILDGEMSSEQLRLFLQEKDRKHKCLSEEKP